MQKPHGNLQYWLCIVYLRPQLVITINSLKSYLVSPDSYPLPRDGSIRQANPHDSPVTGRREKKRKDTKPSFSTTEQGNTMTSTQEIAPPEEKNSFDLSALGRLGSLGWRVVTAAFSNSSPSSRMGFPVGSVRALLSVFRDSYADVRRRKSRML